MAEKRATSKPKTESEEKKTSAAKPAKSKSDGAAKPKAEKAKPAEKTTKEKTTKTPRAKSPAPAADSSSDMPATKKLPTRPKVEKKTPAAPPVVEAPPPAAKKAIRVEVVKKVDVDKRKAEEAAREAAMLKELEERGEVVSAAQVAPEAAPPVAGAQASEPAAQAAREAAAREAAAAQAAREAAAREAAAAQAAREAAAREAAAREAAAREAAAREAAAREAAAREAAREVAREKNLPPPKTDHHREQKVTPVSKDGGKSTVVVKEAAAAASGEFVKIRVSFPLTLGDLAPKLNKSANELIKQLMLQGKMMTINHHLDEATAKKIAQDFGVELEVVDPLELQEQKEEAEDPSKLKPRPPVVTVMGHVDHGKTSLLDAIRRTNVTASEEGGITQRIGAYQVELNGRKITFLDTPGHEAFTAMRARGTKITDVAVLVVAADDGVMPQTLEAIDHAKAANVPIVVAVNKIDKPNANPDRVKQQLSDHGLVPEEWGGTTVFVPVSAKQKVGMEELLEMILLVADLADVKANPEKPARGTIIEAKLDRGKGPVSTVLIQEGTLRVGDSFVAGNVYGKIRAFINDRGERIQDAPPSLPVEIVGLNDVPEAGDALQVVPDEKVARSIAEARTLHSREQTLASLKRVTLDDLYQQIQEGEIKDLNLIIKADGQGSVEAIRDSLERLSTNEVRVRIIHTGVGTITESDVMLAAASNAIIIGFNIRPEPHIKNIAEREKVDLRLYRVIYQAIEDITQAMVGLRKPSIRENVIGRAEVLRTFKISKVGTIAGCRVTDGKLTRDAEVRVIRDGAVVYEGKLASLKRFKDDAREVQSGFECGLGIERFNDLKERDIVEAFVMEEVRQTDLVGKVEVN